MSPIEYIRAAYRHRHDLVPQLLAVLAMGAILTYHALTSPHAELALLQNLKATRLR
ncbi:hypothetical protein [Paraburkholderia aromaticivorans]|uniref:hypothetical protein n=1 Tax=Paraburkholderia aromaticivorans TaxID=2026199 RepID=UPI0012FE513E|nr:hypothetical protein [Paraburkholderia aromaticivorans]